LRPPAPCAESPAPDGRTPPLAAARRTRGPTAARAVSPAPCVRGPRRQHPFGKRKHIMAHISVSREIGGRTLTLETGKVAKLATSAIMARYGESAVLATCVRANPREGLDFFPLQID